MGRQHRAAVAALDLAPLPMTWAQRIAWHLPDAEPEPVMCAAWQTVARWLKRPEPTGEAARRYVKRAVSKLIECGVLARIPGVRPRLGEHARYTLRISRNVDGQGDTRGGQTRPSTQDGLSPSIAPIVPLDTMYLDLGTNMEVPNGQLALANIGERPCEMNPSTPSGTQPSDPKASMTTGRRPRSTASFSTTMSSRSIRRRTRSRRPVGAERARESDMARKTKHPTLFDVPAPVIAAAQPGDATAHTIVGEWLSRCQVRPPGRIIGQAGKLIKEMLAEGIEPDDVRRGMAAWMGSGQHPATIPSFVHTAQVERAAPASSVARGRRSTTDEKVAATLAMGRELQARIDAAGGDLKAVGW